jgi:hypothetical protein
MLKIDDVTFDPHTFHAVLIEENHFLQSIYFKKRYCVPFFHQKTADKLLDNE